MTESAAELRRTPLFDTHVESGGKMVPFGGWEMPLHYGSQIEEHLATRSNAGIFDVSHMGQIAITGRHALDLVQAIITADAGALGDGEEVYTVICREDGGLVDDLIVSRFGPEDFFIVVNAGPYAKDVAFMQEVARERNFADTVLKPCAEDWAMIALQGRTWVQILERVIGPGSWSGLKPFKTVRLQYQGAPLILSTTGYTGEPGCEFLCAPEGAPRLWRMLAEGGARPIGLAARDSLRLEKGYCLSGQDFTEANNPYEAGLARVVKLGKAGEFRGKAALAKIKAAGPKRKLMGFLPEGRRIPRHGNPILGSDGAAIGEITSGGYSPSLERPVAMGYIETAMATPGNEVQIDLGRGSTQAVVTRPPFYPPKQGAGNPAS
jgi:aminomethyltransferase